MTVTTEVKAVLSAENRASPVVRTLIKDLERLEKTVSGLAKLKVSVPTQATVQSATAAKATEAFTRTEAQAMAALRRKWTFETRMGRQKAAEAREQDQDRRAFESAAVRDLQQRMGFSTRMARQALAEQRTVENERQRAAAQADREAAASARHQINLDNYRFALRDRWRRQEQRDRDRDHRNAARHARDAYQHGRDVVRPVGVAALAGTAAAGAAAQRILTVERGVDAAEINTRSYGGLNAEAARSLRDKWAVPLAEELGSATDKLLTAWTDATKLGIPAAGAKAFAELSTKTSAAWEVPLEQVADTFGTINTLLTSKGAPFSADRLKSVANTLQHLAAKQSTTPEKLISFLQRGAGAAQVLGMSQEAGLAFGSASTSLGNQAGSSGRLFDYIASRVIELPRLTKQHGDEGKQARELVSALGYGSAEAMERKRLADPDSFLPDLVERFAKIRDPRRQDRALRFFTGREWLGEFGRIVKGADTYREAQKLAKEARGLDAIGRVWELHRTKLDFVMKQFRAGWLNIMGEFGKVLSPMARQAGDFWLGWTAKLRNGGLAARFKASIEGLLNGLGFRDLPDMLNRVFGKPGEGDAGAISVWKATFRGFGAGVRDVVDGIRGLVTTFTGGSPETIARWTGRILTLSAALVVLSPVLGVLGSLATGLLALSSAATALSALGLAGGAGAAGAAAALTTAGGIIGAAFLATVAKHFNILQPPDTSKGWGRAIVEFLDPGLASRLFGDAKPDTGKGWADPPARLQKQSYNGGHDDRPAFQKASLVVDELAGSIDRLGRTLTGRLASGVSLASIGSASPSVLSGFAGSGAVPGFPGAGGTAGGAGRGPSVPGWYGGSGGGSATSNPQNSAASAAMLDAIAGTESGKAGYDAVLGNGKYGMPSKPVSQMTLDEAFAFGRQVRARHGSSSALGRYQIVGTTMRAAQKALGIDGSTVFNAETQDRMARWIARSQGLGAWEGLKHNPAAMARARAAMTAGGAQDAPTGAASGSGANVAGGVHPLGGKGRLTSDFGMRLHPKLGIRKFHAGIDLAAPAGSAVKAMQDGTVSIDRSGDVTVKHPDGTSTTYRHLTAGVEQGAKVAAGDTIGSLRAHDPRSTGPHLHLEARDANGALRDPKSLLSAAPAATEGFRSSGWKRQDGSPALATPTPAEAADKIPPIKQLSPWKKQGGEGAGQGGGAGSTSPSTGATIHVTNNISGANQSPQELAGAIQRHVTEAWNYRSHDLEPELT